jgi:hypothetical protein
VSLINRSRHDVGWQRLVELDSVGATIEERPNCHAGFVGACDAGETSTTRGAPFNDLANREDSGSRQAAVANAFAETEYPLGVIPEIAYGRNARCHA